MPRPRRDESPDAAAGSRATAVTSTPRSRDGAPPASPGRATSAAPGPRAADLVADAVRAGILSGELAPGTPLREEELSATHGVSRHIGSVEEGKLGG